MVSLVRPGHAQLLALFEILIVDPENQTVSITEQRDQPGIRGQGSIPRLHGGRLCSWRSRAASASLGCLHDAAPVGPAFAQCGLALSETGPAHSQQGKFDRVVGTVKIENHRIMRLCQSRKRFTKLTATVLGHAKKVRNGIPPLSADIARLSANIADLIRPGDPCEPLSITVRVGTRLFNRVSVPLGRWN